MRRLSKAAGSGIPLLRQTRHPLDELQDEPLSFIGRLQNGRQNRKRQNSRDYKSPKPEMPPFYLRRAQVGLPAPIHPKILGWVAVLDNGDGARRAVAAAAWQRALASPL
jgi:hypothetical protein